ncbi:MAG TPA: hypothetical protein VMU53_13125 [Candidatus Sulfotelmatobacter sp.]|nr:hypothetical protein [Candidatus Sulfotelmatobacter sp.]
MARTRTTKKLAQRVDLNYFKRATTFKRAKLWLSVLLPLVAVGWIAWRGAARDSRVYSSGRMSEAHAVLERQCGACHVEKAGQFSANAADSACLACHGGPMHHADEVAAKVPHCAECHAEHRGRVNISAVNDQVCAACHANLKTQVGVSAAGLVFHETHIRSFEDGHPEFAAVQPPSGYPPRDPGTIKVNHAIHLKPIRRGPNGPNVQLECRDCHRVQADAAVIYSGNSNPMVPLTNWTYASPRYVAEKPTYAEQDAGLLRPMYVNQPYRPPTGREVMAPVSFAKACAGCHLLTFDKRFEEGVPHDTPEVVHVFLVKKFQEYIAVHPNETRVAREPKRDLTGKPIPPDVQLLTPARWVEERTADAEELLWRKTCKQCHELRMPAIHLASRSGETPAAVQLPEIARDYTRMRLPKMPQAKFDHDAHRSFRCEECHAKALSSTQSMDILLPGIATCKTCHAPGPEHAESQCFECHTYHNWAKRKEVRAAFELPGLPAGGK